jgi:hypothetical protein
MPMWVPFATALLGIVVGAILTAWRESRAAKRNAVATFWSAFAEAVTQIDNKDAHFLMNQAQAQHDVAIYEFRRFVDPGKLKDFDLAVEKFRLRRSELIPATLAVWQALGSGKPIDNSNTVTQKKALTELLEFADRI